MATFARRTSSWIVAGLCLTFFAAPLHAGKKNKDESADPPPAPPEEKKKKDKEPPPAPPPEESKKKKGKDETPPPPPPEEAKKKAKDTPPPAAPTPPPEDKSKKTPAPTPAPTPPPATAAKPEGCKASYKSVSVEITAANCSSCGSKGVVISDTHCQLEVTSKLRVQMCTVAFSGNKNPEQFTVPYNFGEKKGTVTVSCPGKT